MSVKERISQTDRVINKLFIALIIALILAVIGFLLSGIVTAAAHESSRNNTFSRDNQKITVTWLETNDTKTSSTTPPIIVSDKEFWMVFGSLIKQSNNGSTVSSE